MHVVSGKTPLVTSMIFSNKLLMIAALKLLCVTVLRYPGNNASHDCIPAAYEF